jgi:hypothetical protein
MKNQALSVVAAAFLVGCAVPVSEEGAEQEVEETSEVSAALPMAGGVIWGTPGNNGAPLMLGNTSQETCFLSGVSGSLVGRPGVNGSLGPLPALAEVYPQNGKWWVRTKAGTGQGVSAHVDCIRVPYSGKLATVKVNKDSIVWQRVPFESNLHCFLTRIQTTGLSSPFHYVKIIGSNDGPNGPGWYVDALYDTEGGDYGFGSAAAVCVTVPATASWSFTFTGPTNATNSATSTFYLRNYFPDGPRIPTADVGCFLTGITGRWISGSPDPLGWDNGIFLRNETQYWRMTTSNGRTGHVRCLR